MKRLSLLSSDVKAMLFLVVFVVVGMLMIYFSGADSAEKDVTPLDSIAAANAKKSPFYRDSVSRRRDENAYYHVEPVKHELFPFDPNTADSTQLLRLGLQPWQVRNIYKYRAAGGIYRKPEDFARLYGLTVKQYETFRPYIRISRDYLPASTLIKDTLVKRDTTLYPIKLKATERVVLNMADTTTLKKVPGIGSGYANAIRAYGERLGGYVDINQLDEIDGFPTESKSYFIIQNPQTRKMNLNTMSLSTMRKHPYMGFYRAKAVVDYRNKNGHIGSLSDLHLHRDFTPDAIERLKPYVEF